MFRYNDDDLCLLNPFSVLVLNPDHPQGQNIIPNFPSYFSTEYFKFISPPASTFPHPVFQSLSLSLLLKEKALHDTAGGHH